MTIVIPTQQGQRRPVLPNLLTTRNNDDQHHSSPPASSTTSRMTRTLSPGIIQLHRPLCDHDHSPSPSPSHNAAATADHQPQPQQPPPLITTLVTRPANHCRAKTVASPLMHALLSMTGLESTMSVARKTRMSVITARIMATGM